MKAIVFAFIVIVLQACSSSRNGNNTKHSENNEIALDFTAGEPITIYKTKKDYSKNVAVILSEDKSKIVSYPHPSDVYYRGNLAYPTKLDKDYLLDNFGINSNVAYLSISIEKYSEYKEAPSLIELYDLIIDQNPITELYYCGNRQNLKDELTEVNSIINEGLLKECKCLVK